MAQVYLARDRSLDRPVAVKELVPEFATDPNFVERFRRELKPLPIFMHANIVGVYDWGQDGTYFIVMEYVDGPVAVAGPSVRMVRSIHVEPPRSPQKSRPGSVLPTAVSFTAT